MGYQVDRRKLMVAVGAGALTALALSHGSKKPKPVHCTGPECDLVNQDIRRSLSLGDRYSGEQPSVDLPEVMRTKNYAGGSCVHASTINLLEWQGHHDLAKWWRQNYAGGEYSTRLHERLERAGLRWAATVRGSVEFLEWCCSTRRGAGIGYFESHAINIVHLDNEKAGLLDNNRIHQIIWVPRDRFIRNWHGYGGWAWTIVYSPPPPIPYVNEA